MVLWLVLMISTVVESWRWRGPVHPDWLIARRAAHSLFGQDGFNVYAVHPDAQMGPLALALSLLPRHLYLVLVAASVIFCFLPLASREFHWTGKRRAIAVLSILTVPFAWSQLAWKGHADDALVSIGLCWMALGSRSLKPWGFALAIAGKPTALVALPFVLVEGMQVAMTALLLTGLVWTPFLFADAHALLRAGKGIMPVGRGSLSDFLGYAPGSRIPIWVRPAQLIAGLVATSAASLAKRPLEGLVAAFSCRALVETNPAPAYSIPIVIFAAMSDLQRNRWALLPLSLLGFFASQPVLDGSSGLPRLVALALCVAAASWTLPEKALRRIKRVLTPAAVKA